MNLNNNIEKFEDSTECTIMKKKPDEPFKKLPHNASLRSLIWQYYHSGTKYNSSPYNLYGSIEYWDTSEVKNFDNLIYSITSGYGKQKKTELGENFNEKCNKH